ncbi:MAG: hypothetical protein EBU77_13480, partial [Betaproteobacteria bacterium]|nr:hypothetical protein [Betaproteobacteria bacterium]
MQITPLIDVLLVLLVMGVLAWSASQASGHARVKASASSDALLGLQPLQPGQKVSVGQRLVHRQPHFGVAIV